MCRFDASIHSHSRNSHEQLAAGGLRTPTGSGNKHSNARRHGHGRNSLDEPLHANIDQSSRHSARSCRYGSACRGQFSYCRYVRPVVVDTVLSDWSVVARRRRSRTRGAVVNDIFYDDAIIDSLNDIDIANHYEHHSEISAPDALHDSFS